MPRPFVLRLREIREKQLELRRKAEQAQMNENMNQNNNNNNPNPGNILPGLSREALEEFMEEAN